MEKMRCESRNLVEANIAKIAELFPCVVTESRAPDGRLEKKIDFDKLRQLMSAEILEGKESYEFTWPGKKASIVEAGRQIRKTLRPCPDESRNWDTTENLYIEGDNLDVLKLLQENYLGKVKMIYIDPPYNTGSDFIYRDDFSMDRNKYDEITGAVARRENVVERERERERENARTMPKTCPQHGQQWPLPLRLVLHDLPAPHAGKEFIKRGWGYFYKLR